ncbi:MAG: DegQ family serine endoprotease [Acidobacteria bacterium]|nr:DegQ family serine endoprotease [Acidobacteriota bacterium]
MASDFINIGGPASAAPKWRRKWAAAGTALLLTGGLVGWTAADRGAGAIGASVDTPAAVERTVDPAAGTYAPVVERAGPAVVTIRSERMVRSVSQELPDHPLFREFFGDQSRGQRPQPDRREGGMGSGVIVRQDGYILTNNHVVDKAEVVNVELTDGRSFKAKVVGTDAPSDLAVLKIEGSNLQTLTLGDSDDVRVGDIVLAVGNPLGIGQTVTMGIVSAKGRATGGAGDGSFEDFIQTDAAINRGNSGGALVNTAGELIGINSQILSPSGVNIGIGFAIPTNMARNVMTQLINGGEVRRGKLGVTIQGITPALAESLGLNGTTGALVGDVEAGSPAAKAGIKSGDVITAINGESVKDSNVLRNEIAQLQPGTSVKITILRDGKEQILDATLGALQAAGNTRDGKGDGEGEGTFGLSVEPLTANRARELGVEVTSGLVVAAVTPGGRAASAGLQAGDVIAQVDKKPVTNGEDLRAALKNGSRPALLTVHRGGVTMFVAMPRQE